ncbi:hypothetical protein MVEN_00717800 [Mycena venus]|uniref:Uncharacterized protein n=1 Tax=Mycena venus TaxID=2733690 RepID=A0A8H7D2Q1_9AGAR|nr:hypothetical protein MVEN_00717800 [Mycena venus]
MPPDFCPLSFDHIPSLLLLRCLPLSNTFQTFPAPISPAADSWALRSRTDAFGAPSIGGIMSSRVKKVPVGSYERDLADGTTPSSDPYAGGQGSGKTAQSDARVPIKPRLSEPVASVSSMTDTQSSVDSDPLNIGDTLIPDPGPQFSDDANV